MPRIATITLLVPDYDSGIRFYIDDLGFELLEDMQISPGKRWVRVAPQGAETAILLAKAATPQQHAATGNQTGGRVGFFLETDDFDRDYARMQKRGVTFLETPRRENYGTVAVFTDPFGNKWDLIEMMR
ncbi:MAG: VOC family protein [Pseudomonadota bacterium]